MRKHFKFLLSVTILSGLATITGCKTAAPVVVEAAPAPVVYAVLAEGEILPSLTKITDMAISSTPYGGDDGGPLFYAYTMDGGHWDIYKKETPLSNATVQMTNLGTTGFAWFPAYNKATDKIVFSMGDDIYTMPATKGKALTQITSTPNQRELHSSFSPDGNLIIFDRITSGDWANAQIWVKNLQTGENILLGQGVMPAYSPDGKKIVYVKYQGIWIMDSNGENQSRLTDNNTLRSAEDPQFSPDGKYIIFNGTAHNENTEDLYIVSVDGGDLTRLTISKARDFQAYWSNDGYIYFVSDRGDKKGNCNIWRFKYSPK